MTNASPGIFGDIKLIAGTSSPDMSQEISDYLSNVLDTPTPLSERLIKKFPNDNTYVQLGGSLRGQDVYIIQTLCRPVNDNLMELLIALDAIRRDSAGRITTVMPYFAYGRSDRKDNPRTPITARLVADLIEVAGADRYVTIDLHAGQLQGFFGIPGDALTAYHLLKDHVRKSLPTDNLMVVTVDLGFAKGGRNWSRALGVPLAFVEKSRKDTTAQAISLIGDVKGRNVLLVDDEVDTAGSLVHAIEMLDAEGAQEITVAFTHPVLSPPAAEHLAKVEGRVREFITTNTIPHAANEGLPKMTVISVAPLLGEVIRRAHLGMSVGALFNE